MKKGTIKRILSGVMVFVMTLSCLNMYRVEHVQASVTYAEDLFISEYIEGSSYNKAIEIYNGTGNTVNLSNYNLMKDYNGDGEFNLMYQFEEGQTLNHGKVFVVYHSSFDESTIQKLDENLSYGTGNISFNGDDQVALYKGDIEEIDRIGISGDKDFGKDHTYVREPNVMKGLTGEQDPGDNGEWIEYAKNTFDYLGSHIASYGSTKVANVSASQPSGEVSEGTEITLACTTSGAIIKYAIDPVEGTSPSMVKYENPIEINKDTTILTQAIKDGLEDSDLVTFEYTIRDEQTVMDIATAKNNDDGSIVKVMGTVTENEAEGYVFIQDNTAAIGIRFNGEPNLKIGDTIEVYGELSSYYGYRYIDVAYLSDFKVTGTGEVMPSVVGLGDIGEAYESQLIKVENVKVISGPEYGREFKVENGNSDFRLKPIDGTWLESGVIYESVVGVVHYSYGKYVLVSPNELDITEDSSRVRKIKANVESGSIEKGAEVILLTLTEGAEIYYTLDGSQPDSNSFLYTQPIIINSDTTLKAVAIKEELTNSEVLTLDLTVLESVGEVTISEIQGGSHQSPYILKTVERVEGIVTGILDYKFDFMGGKRITGFYMQAETSDGKSATSDAIFVFTGTDVEVGDKVKVTGMVNEYVKEMDFYAYDQENQLTVTSIEASDVEVVSKGNALPEAIRLGEKGRTVPHDLISSDNFEEYDESKYAIDFYESLESMRVVIDNPLVVAPEHNRVLAVVPDNGAIAKEDEDLSIMGGVILQEDDVNTEILQLNGAIVSLGDIKSIEPGATSSETVEGLMDYEWGAYQVYITKELPTFTNADREEDSLQFDKNEDELTIASYNVYNHGGDDKESKTVGIADAIVNDLGSPDIIGLVEVQDNDGKAGGTGSTVVDASEVYGAFINKIKELGGPEYAWTDIPPVDDQEGGEPGGNIRVGYLYNPDRVTLKAGVAKGGSTDTVEVDQQGHLTLNPGRIAATEEAFNDTRKSLAAEFIFRGEEVIVIANHFSSKGGDNATYGNIQPAIKHSEVERVKQAQLVNDFIDTILAANPEANIVALGDLNDFQFSNSVKALKGEGEEQVLVNMIDELPLAEQFTYNYGGNSQVLDNILVSQNLVVDTKVDVLNINSIISDEDDARRHSDHDAVIVGIAGIGTDKEVMVEDVMTTSFMSLTPKVEFEEGEFVTISANITSINEEVDTGTVLYKIVKDDKMVRFGMLEPVALNISGIDCRMGFGTENLSRGTYRVEVFVWDNFSDANALSDKGICNFTIK
ncbi:chitobiase/beta-hexosaminidase C-terminal domain-containing protein [Vallitalea okinawensis]|uniref:chitobiase/beta-hexosaminidase C-terminal domain-containing protein n=1 Tax=Vallitalea okinawensis TaxID=2078660 RepID=UPI000CFC4C0F|nr:chitobiase/beta-hexosaminidase C-terminal domain-containing protein [Vallitalea okinawensis]